MHRSHYRFNMTNSTGLQEGSLSDTLPGMGDNVSEVQDEAPDFEMSISEKDMLPAVLPSNIIMVLLITYVFIMASAVVSNTTVIVVIVRINKLRTVTNTFLLSLAVSDLLIAVVNMPLQLTYHIRNEWTLGVPACKVSTAITEIISSK